MSASSKKKVKRIKGASVRMAIESIVREVPVSIYLNGSEYAVLMATPTDLKQLALGFLLGEGAITAATAVEGVKVNRLEWIVRVELAGEFDSTRKRGLVTSGCAAVALYKGAFELAGVSRVSSKLRLGAGEVQKLLRRMIRRCDTYQETGGIHSAAIADKGGILLFGEDVGRHNAVDKVIGQAYLDGMEMGDKVLLCTGRISSEILVKAARRGLPVVVSRTSPTDLSVRLAGKLGITLIGFVRGGNVSVYSGMQRITG
jgi:FdhD protein